MRRNILTYKAPPNNEGYDLICIHPDPRKVVTRQIRVQVKSRFASDSDLGFPVKAITFGAFDFLVAVFLNIGNFHRGDGLGGRTPPVFYTFPASFIRRHHNMASSWEKVRIGKLRLDRYKNESGFELIAKALKIDYPARPRG